MPYKRKIILVLIFCLMLFSMLTPAFAVEGPKITTGLDQVDSDALANKLLKIAIGGGALSGVVAAIVLIILGFKLKVGGEQSRAKTKEHIVYVFIGMGLVAFAIVITGFAAFLLMGN